MEFKKGYTLKGTEDYINRLKHNLTIRTGHVWKSNDQKEREKTIVYSESLNQGHFWNLDYRLWNWNSDSQTSSSNGQQIVSKRCWVIRFIRLMGDLLLKSFLITSSLVTHSIRGVLTAVHYNVFHIISVVIKEWKWRIWLFSCYGIHVDWSMSQFLSKT